MSQFLLVIAVALTVGAIVFGIIVMITGDDRGLSEAEPDGRALPLPADRPLLEADLTEVKFDTTVRGYRMAQVDAALDRLGYDIGYKDELIKVLQAEVDALREGRLPDAEVLRRAREAAAAPGSYAPAGPPGPASGTIELSEPGTPEPDAGDASVPDAEPASVPDAEPAAETADVETEATPGPFR